MTKTISLRRWAVAVLLGALGLLVAAWLPARDRVPQGAAPRESKLTPRDPSYQLVKDWDFVSGIRTRAALEAEFFTRYIYADGKQDHVGDEWSRYRDEDNHVFTEQGLALVARPSSRIAPGQIASGMLRSRWTGKYGLFEIRMKVPKGRGLWPAFWLNPEDKRWPPEIDIVEIVNNRDEGPDRTFHFLHGAGKSEELPLVTRLGKDKAYVAGVDLSRAFHVYAAEWTPERVRHFVDGVLVSDRAYRWIHTDGSDGGPAHVLVNLAVGGKWPGPPSDPAAFPARLVISNLRVWQR